MHYYLVLCAEGLAELRACNILFVWPKAVFPARPPMERCVLLCYHRDVAVSYSAFPFCFFGLYSATPISPHVVCCLLFSSPALFLGAHGHGWHFLLDLLIPPPVCTASSRTSSSSGVSSLSDVVCSAVWVPTFCLVLVFSRPSGLFIFPWFPCFCFFWFSWSFLVLG